MIKPSHKFLGWTIILLLSGLLLEGCFGAGNMQQWADLARSGAPKLEIFPDRASPKPEQAFKLSIRGSWPAEYQSDEPPYPSYVTSMVVRDFNRSLITEGTTAQLEVNLTVEAMNSGIHMIPSIPLILTNPEGTEIIVRTLPLYLDVRQEGAETATDIRPLKPLRVTISYLPAVYVSLIVFLLLAAGGFLLWRNQRNRKPPLTPEQQIEEGLQKMMAQSSENAVVDKPLSFDLSFLIRNFMEQKTGIPALEMTDFELSLALRRQPDLADRDIWLALHDLARTLEEIKFSKREKSSHSVHSRVREIKAQVQLLTKPEVTQ